MNLDQTAVFRKALGAGVRKARRSIDISQGELGRRMRPTRVYNTISELEHGRYPVLLETLIQIAEITETPIGIILGPALETLQQADEVVNTEPPVNEWTEPAPTRRLTKAERAKLFAEGESA